MAREVEQHRLPQATLDMSVEFLNGLKSQFNQLIRSKFLFYAKF